MSAYHCVIPTCRARLLGFAYFTLILDNDKRIAVCPSCFRKVNAVRAERGLDRLTGWRSVRMPDAEGTVIPAQPLPRRGSPHISS